MDNWKDATISLARLRYEASHHGDLDSAKAFLKSIGLVPEGAKFYDRTVVISTSNDAKAISVKYLATMAHEWDSMGPSTPDEFVTALAFECSGTSERDAVAETLSALGAILREESLAA